MVRDDADDIEGIPHCMVFDHTGECVFRGHPMEAHDAVEAAVKAVPGAVLGGRVLAKLPELNSLLQDERKFVVGMRSSSRAPALERRPRSSRPSEGKTCNSRLL
jgi:hypothetical protein